MIMWEEISAYFYRQKIILKRRPGELSVIFIHPLISLLSMGLLAFFIIQNGGPATTLIFVFVGIITWDFYDLVQRGVTFGITFDIWSESMKHSFSAKAKPKHFIIGNSLFGLANALIVFVLVGIVGYLIFSFNIFSAGLFLINLASVLFFAIGIGLIINSLMVSKGEKYMALIWVMTGFIMVFSGVYYPVEVLPSPVMEVAQMIPATHSINSMRAAFGFSPELLFPELFVGLMLSLVYLLVGVLIFKLGLQKGYENGTITKF